MRTGGGVAHQPQGKRCYQTPELEEKAGRDLGSITKVTTAAGVAVLV